MQTRLTGQVGRSADGLSPSGDDSDLSTAAASKAAADSIARRH